MVDSYNIDSYTTLSWTAESLTPVVVGQGGLRTLDRRTLDSGPRG